MNEHKQIDWSRVVPGTTWLESPNGCLCRVDAIMGEDVWVFFKDKQDLDALHYTWAKSAIAACKWTIHEEWVDVTHECTFEEIWRDGVPHVVVVHRGSPVNLGNGGYRITPNSIYKRRPL